MKVKFTTDYATFKKDDVWEASRDLMAMVVREGVAEYVSEKPKESQKKATRKKKK